METEDQTLDFDRISMISQASSMIAELSKSDITEVKSFAAPPVAVKDVLTATLLLLRGLQNGKDPWKEVKQMLADPNLTKSVADIDYEKIPVETRKKAMTYLSKYNAAEIRKVNKAVMSFYQWALAVASQ